MIERRTVAPLLAAAPLAMLALAPMHAVAASPRHLSEAEMRSRFTGRMLTDGAHWSETYDKSGRLVVNDVGNVSTGTWRVADGRLCKLRPGVLDGCYEVWIDHDAVELRHTWYAPVLATLKEPTPRR